MGNAPRSSNRDNLISIQQSTASKIQTTSISIVPEIDLSVHIHKSSFKLIQFDLSSALTFNFDSLSVCLITIYYFGMEALSKTSCHTRYFTVDHSKQLKPECYKFPIGLNQKFPINTSFLNFNQYAYELACCEKYKQFPIIITIIPENAGSAWYESTFLRVFKENDCWKPIVLLQKIHNNESSFYLDDIYGLSDSEIENSSCVVCYNEKKSVTMMPCKHLCLCESCAEILAEANIKKCPICRALVNELLYISR